MTDDSSIFERILPHMRAMPPYIPVEPPEFLAERLGLPVEAVLKLDANENPYGPSPAVLEALAAFRGYNIYPDPQQRNLRAALSEYTGFSPEWLIAGAGSDELIDLMTRMFVAPGEAILNFPPTFGMYAFSADLEDADLVNIPRRKDFSIDLDAVSATAGKARLIFVVSPNNPTGTPLLRKELDALLATGSPVVVDEAYAEFAGESYVELVREHANLIVIRTLSKWAGLAGLRIGYMVAAPEVIEVAFKVKQPYSVSVAAEVAAIAAIVDRDFQFRRVAAIVAERERLAAALQAIGGIEVLPSKANFLLCRLAGLPAREVHARLADRGIMVRYYDTPMLQNHIRITVGKPEHTDAVVSALREILGIAQTPTVPSPSGRGLG
jgi:histidinol-phosphate aminotransferase